MTSARGIGWCLHVWRVFRLIAFVGPKTSPTQRGFFLRFLNEKLLPWRNTWNFKDPTMDQMRLLPWSRNLKCQRQIIQKLLWQLWVGFAIHSWKTNGHASTEKNAMLKPSILTWPVMGRCDATAIPCRLCLVPCVRRASFAPDTGQKRWRMSSFPCQPWAISL